MQGFHIAVYDHAVHDDLGKDREQQLQSARDDGQEENLHQGASERFDELKGPSPGALIFRCRFERRRVVHERGIATPFFREGLSRNALVARGRVNDVDIAFGDALGDDPVVAFPVDNGGHSDSVDVLRLDLNRAGGESQFVGGTDNGAQAGAIQGRMGELADARKADPPTVVTAYHGQGCGPTIHLINLANIGDPFAPGPGFSCGLLFLFGCFGRSLCVHAIDIEGFGVGALGQDFLGEVQRYLGLCLVGIGGHAVFHGPGKFFVTCHERLQGFSLHTEQTALGNALNGGRPRGALQC